MTAAVAAPTHNPHCDQVRATHAAARSTWKLPATDLELAKAHAEAARKLLGMAYELVKRHPTLAIQTETAGKSARHLRDALDARLTEAAR